MPQGLTRSLLDCIGRTPLIELRKIGAGARVPILGKCEHLNPGGSVKDRIARAIIEDAEARGALPKTGGTIVEATAGNTGIGLAMVAALHGHALVVVMPEKMSIDKRNALSLLGARVVIAPNAKLDDPQNFQQVARRLAAEHGWFLADQFVNGANVRAHEATTGPEILEQTGGVLGAFVAGVGTGGTISGVGHVLKARAPKVRIVVADPVGSALADFIERGAVVEGSAYAMEGIGASRPPEVLDRAVIDEVERVSDDESFAMTHRLIREEGLLVGGSSGCAVVAALRVASRDDVREPVVVLLADSWDRYWSKPWMQAALPTA